MCRGPPVTINWKIEPSSHGIFCVSPPVGGTCRPPVTFNWKITPYALLWEKPSSNYNNNFIFYYLYIHTRYKTQQKRIVVVGFFLSYLQMLHFLWTR